MPSGKKTRPAGVPTSGPDGATGTRLSLLSRTSKTKNTKHGKMVLGAPDVRQQGHCPEERETSEVGPLGARLTALRGLPRHSNGTGSVEASGLPGSRGQREELREAGRQEDSGQSCSDGPRCVQGRTDQHTRVRKRPKAGKNHPKGLAHQALTRGQAQSLLPPAGLE